jgi:hypothetical protein
MNAALDDVIAAGVAFLRRSAWAEASGLWRDFALPGVSTGSTDCVSAFIAAQIAALPEGRELAASVVGGIASRARETGGWGYREDVPEDCDSTAWVLLSAAAAGVDLPRPLIERSTAFIASNQRASGGFVTYGPDAKESLTPSDQAGWFEPEVSVTASATLALAITGEDETERLRRACRYLERNCRDGLWGAYWWRGFGYSTYLSLLALSKAGRGLDGARAAATEQAILLRSCAGGGWANAKGAAANGFSTSFALRSLLLLDRPRAGVAVDEAVSYLSGLVTDTGLVTPSAEMLAPGGFEGRNVVLRDSGNVTTACVIRALHEARTRLAK